MSYEQLIERQQYQIEAYLRVGFSYQEIGKRLKVRDEWIYGCVQRDKFSGGKLYKQLRYGRRKYRKNSRATRVIIPNHVGKEHRPAVVDRKRRFGYWEADTVLGKNGTGAIVSLVERKSRFYLIRKVPAVAPSYTNHCTTDLRCALRRHVHTVTADNGAELCGHQLVAEKLKTDVYFANLYSSWERGLNENVKGLQRQYISKGTALSTVTEEQIAQAQRTLNLRPRKYLGYKRPEAVFNKLRGAA